MNEEDFKRRLAELIKTYDECHARSIQTQNKWEMAWRDLIVEANENQCDRAYQLLELHLLNKYK